MSVEVRPSAPGPGAQRTESIAPAGHPSTQSAPGATRAVNSEQLFSGATELLIDHHGVLYRLRHTALGKLILTK
ncbi:MAG: hemin uptake protein HemP [Caldimonas sp.]